MDNSLNSLNTMDPKGDICENVKGNTKTNIIENLEKFYDEIIKKENYLFITKKNGKYGIIYNGKVSCDCIFDEIVYDSFLLPFLKVKQGKKYGLVSIEGEKLFDSEYDDLEIFYHKPYIGVKKGNKRGLRHTKELDKREYKYDKIINRMGSDYFYVSVDGKWGVLNEEGVIIIEPQFKEVHAYPMDIIGVKNVKIEQEKKQGQSEDEKTEKIAIFNGEGKQISDFVYDSIDLNLMDEGKKEDNVMIHTTKEMVVMKIGNHKGILTNNGELFLPAEYDNFGDKWTEGLLPAKKNGKWGIVNEKGEIIVDFVYDGIKSFLGGLAVVELNGKQGLINNKGEVILEPKLDNVRNFGEGMGGINENGNPWFINDKGEKLKKIEYNNVGEFNEGIATVKQGGKWGFIDKDLNLVCDFKYDNVGNFHNKRAVVQNGNKYGFIDEKGNEICGIKYEDVNKFDGGRSIVKRDGKYGVIDMDGNETYFGIEGCITDFNLGLAAVWEKIDNEIYRYYFIDKNGKEIGKDRGYSFTMSMNGIVTARKNGQDILLNEEGEEIDRAWDLKSEWFEGNR